MRANFDFGSKTNETYNYLPAENGKYVAILTPGRYEVVVSADPFMPITETLILYDKSSFKAEIKKDYIFEPPPQEE